MLLWLICGGAVLLQEPHIMLAAGFLGLMALPKCGAIFYSAMVHGNIKLKPEEIAKAAD
ncbi:hypothetical protein [Shewanella sp.]|uniref:hypothetical protein n=1 Tax=Shewanella sp. TaxID=50422 RepID=UPI003A983685